MDTAISIHGTVISYQGMGCVLTGAPGVGKSRLAQEAIALGARLVADDRVQLTVQSGLLVAAAPAPLMGILEMRGIGIIRVGDALARQVLHLVVELDPTADAPLPEPDQVELQGITLPRLRLAPPPRISAAGLILYLRAMQLGGVLPTDWKPGIA